MNIHNNKKNFLKMLDTEFDMLLLIVTITINVI